MSHLFYSFNDTMKEDVGGKAVVPTDAFMMAMFMKTYGE